MNLGQKIYNDLISQRLTIANGYSGVFELYPEITVDLLLDHLNGNTTIGFNKKTICNSNESNIADFFNNTSLPKEPKWLYLNPTMISYGITYEQVEKKAHLTLDILCSIYSEGDKNKSWLEYSKNTNIDNKKLDKGKLAIFLICGLIQSDFMSILKKILVDKHQLNISI